MAKKGNRTKAIEHDKKQLRIPGEKDSPALPMVEAWQKAKDNFCEARDVLIEAEKAGIEAMEKHDVKSIICGGETIVLAVKDATKKLKAKKIDITEQE